MYHETAQGRRAVFLNLVRRVNGATAKVVWSDLAPKEIGGEYPYGLRFESFQEGDLRKLRKLLTEAAETHG